MRFDLADLVRRNGKYRRNRFVARPIVPTVAQEQDLLRLYMRVVRGWSSAWSERIQPVYERTLGEGVRDSVDDVSGATDDAAAALNRLSVELGAELEDWIVRVEQWHRGRFGTLFTATGVKLDTLLGSGDVRATLKSVLGENVSLIRSLDDQMRNGISGAVFRGLQNRTPARDVAREIRAQTAIGKRRAELIASDQLAKLTSRLDQERQEQVGLSKFQWAHSGKAHPRPEHVERDGKIYPWNGPVGQDDPPGRAIRCGCRARAVLDLDEEQADAETTPTPTPAPDPSPAELAQRNARADKTARAYTLRRGRAEGVEHLVSIDARTGEIFERKAGSRGEVQFSAALARRLRDPKERIVLHHNHPSSSSFSDADISVVEGLPGAKSIWAHGHDGSEYFAQPIAGQNLSRQVRQIVSGDVYQRLNALLQGGIIDVEAAQAARAHLIWRILAARGRMEYRFVRRGRSAEIDAQHQVIFDRIVEAVK